MSSKKMIYIQSPSNDPRFNLALEQYVFDHMDRAFRYFILWQNDNTIVVGKHQNTYAEINMRFVKQQNITVVRRLSGGGAVYHDMGNINFTFIDDQSSNRSFDFGLFCRPVQQALAQFGVSAEINGRNDMTIDGKKFSGNSQYCKQGRIMHHGTLMYDSDLDTVERALQVSTDKIQSKGISSIRSRVTNIRYHMPQPVSTSQFFQALRSFMFTENQMQQYELTSDDIAAIRAIQQQRYDCWEWNFGQSSAYQLQKHRRFEGCGTIELNMDAENGRITRLAFFGDYFGNGDQTALTRHLIGVPLCESDLRQALAELQIEDWFHNLSLDDLLDLILC